MEIFDIKNNRQFLHVLATTPRCQLAVMTLEPGKDSGPEDMHPGEQVVYVVSGSVRVEVAGESVTLEEGAAGIIPPRTQHHLYNDGSPPAVIFSVYTPPAY